MQYIKANIISYDTLLLDNLKHGIFFIPSFSSNSFSGTASRPPFQYRQHNSTQNTHLRNNNDSRQTIQHLINEGVWKVIFSCCLVQLLVINTHPPTNYHSCRNQLIVVVLDHYHPTFLGTTCTRLTHVPPEIANIIPAFNNFNIFAFTTSFLMRFNLLCYLIDGMQDYSIMILCM